MLKTTIYGIVLGAVVASSAFAGNYTNKTCKYDLRGLDDVVVFNIDDNGNYYNIKTFQSWKGWLNEKYDPKVDGKAYTNPDGTCGLVNPHTGKKDTPIGYRKGILEDGQWDFERHFGIQVKSDISNG